VGIRGLWPWAPSVAPGWCLGAVGSTRRAAAGTGKLTNVFTLTRPQSIGVVDVFGGVFEWEKGVAAPSSKQILRFNQR